MARKIIKEELWFCKLLIDLILLTSFLILLRSAQSSKNTLKDFVLNEISDVQIHLKDANRSMLTATNFDQYMVNNILRNFTANFELIEVKNVDNESDEDVFVIDSRRRRARLDAAFLTNQ